MSVRLFAVCRERAGTATLDVEFPGTELGLQDLRLAIEAACPALGPILGICRVAVNQEFATEETRIRARDELALIPPVSGGSGLGPFGLRAEPLRIEEVEEAVSVPSAGAVVTFRGTVRDRTDEREVVALEYEAYPEMAERFLRGIGDEVSARWPMTRIAILHRVGRLAVGETSVVIAVSHPHRAAAFEACRHAIERLKQDVPIWKKEIRRDGTVWVGVGS